MDVVIVGGGIAGLATAYYLQKRALAENGPIHFRLIESSDTLGGKIVTDRTASFVVEGGPDSFITQKTGAIELCRELGLSDELIGTNDAARQVYVWSRGQLRPMPEGVMLIVPTKFKPFVTSSLISWPGKLRMGLEAILPPRRDDGDESLAHFIRRRLGAEALDKIAEPMIAGIYVADAENLSLKSTFPRFLDMERKHGSMIRAMQIQKRAAARNPAASGKSAPSMFMTLRSGLQSMVEALTNRLDPGSLMTGCQVVSVAQNGATYRVRLDDGSELDTTSLVMATPTYVTADLIEPTDPELAKQLRSIRYVSTATVSLGFRRSDIAHPLKGFGFVVPRSEKRKIVACTWSSTKFNHRAPDDSVLIRAFVGGAHNEARAEQDEASLLRDVRDELQAMMGITAEPTLARVFRWRKANPQYEVGHQERVAGIERLAAQHPGLFLAGSAYRGVGVPDCIQDGARVASEIVTMEELCR